MDTIFALASARGKSGVAVIRVSGESALKSLLKITHINEKPTPRKARLLKLYSPISGEIIDHALCLYFPAPHSFTGEDVVEYHIHGGLSVINSLIEALSSFQNMRLAEAGEFTKRAFYNEKLDLTEVEGLSDLINAETEQQRKLALRQLQGDLSSLFNQWRESIIKIQALFEAYIDFPDEDLPPTQEKELFDNIEELKKDINSHINDYRRGERLREGYRVALFGAPNTGKSSLINTLSQRNVAIVSEFAGTTRDLIEVHLDLNGYPVTIIDTAGIREADDFVEKEGIRRSKEEIKSSDLQIALFSAEEWPKKDEETQNLIDDHTIIIVNKKDLLNKAFETNDKSIFSVSAKEGDGISELLGFLTKRVERDLELQSSSISTRERHRIELKEAYRALERVDSGHLPELIVEDLRLASRHIGKIIGKIDVDDILDVIFSEFCIGK